MIHIINTCVQNSSIDFTQTTKSIHLRANIEGSSRKKNKNLLPKKDKHLEVWN